MNASQSGPAGDAFSVAGLNILVIGGTRGIGREISLALARAGARVTANYVRSEAAAATLREIAAAEQLQLDLLRADVSIDKGREQLVADVLQLAVPLHGIVFAAATGVHKDLAQVSGRHFDFVFALNVRAFTLLVQGLLPAMTAGGSIMALSSEGAVHVMPHYGLVAASKSALEALCRQWAAELAPRGIRVNVISPGAVRTDAWNVLPGGEARLAAAAEATPGGALVTAEEVASVARFLASPAASGISGHTLVVDRGARTMGSG
jgi:enoyl-[acyl-carrier protein] reductase III